jgi:hypothetical protein
LIAVPEEGQGNKLDSGRTEVRFLAEASSFSVFHSILTTDHSCPSGAEVKNAWSCTSPYA